MASYFRKKKIVDLRKQKVFERDVAEYDATFVLVKKMLKLIGLRLQVTDTKFASFCWSALFWFDFANVWIATVLESIKMFQTAAGGTFLELFTMMPCVGYLVVAMAKASKIKIYRSIFENLISELREMWPKGQITEEENEIVSGALARLKFLIRAYFSCNMTLGSIFIMPTIIVCVKRAAGEDVPLLLPFFYWLPFDPYENGKCVFQIMLFLQTCHCFLAVLFMLTGDLLFCIFLCHITTQFALLTVRINKLLYVPLDDQLIAEYPLGVYSKLLDKTEVNNTSEDEDPQKRIQQELVSIVHRHQALIRLSNDIENMYTFSLLVNFINSSIIICFCLFCVAVVEKWNEIIYKIFFVTAILQIWILCWYGQRLLDTSTGVAEALYNSGWYAASSKVKSSILIMLHRSQNDVHITTYGFSIVSLASYATILKTSWSYFTLMINMYKG